MFATRLRFDTANLAIEWARNVAHSIGFSLVQDSQKHRGGVQYYTMTCDRGGKYRQRSKDPERPTRKHTSTKKCQCPFKLTVRQSAKSSGFGVIPKIGTHNHQLVKYKEGHRQMARLTPDQKEYIKQQSKAHVRPTVIASGFEETYGKESLPDIRQIYYLTSNVRSEKRAGLNHAQHMLAMARKYNYTYFIEKNSDMNELTHVLMSHPEGLRMLRSYPYVVIIDCTYKTNLYDMPLVEIVGITPVGKSFLIAYAIMLDETRESYEWLLEKLKLLLDPGVVPNAIVTDKDMALLGAINRVFSESSHLLCAWHIEKNVETYVKNKIQDGKEADKFIQSKWKPVIYSRSEESYDRRIKMLYHTEYKNIVGYLKSTWLVHDQKFVRCYTDRVLHFGTTTTSRVESAHAVLKEWLGSASCDLDSVWERVHSALGRQHVEIFKSLESSRSKHSHDSHRGLFSLLNGIVSHKAIKLMKEEFDRGVQLGSDLLSRCGCSIYTSCGLLCACRLIDLFQRHEKVFPDDVHIFWRTLVISEPPSVAASDIDLFNSFCVEAINSHPAIFRSATMLLSGLLQPEHEDLEDPAIKETSKGRPRIPRKSTTRNRSGFEHAKRRYPSYVQPEQQFTSTDSLPSQCYLPETDFPLSFGHPSPVVDPFPSPLVYPSPFDSQLPLTESQLDSQLPSSNSRLASLDSLSSENLMPWKVPGHHRSKFPYYDCLPEFIFPYLCGWFNPKADGHCGFRALSHAMRGNEKHWMETRTDLLCEIIRPEYRNIYGSLEYDAGLPHNRIRFVHNRPCGRSNWMDTCDLFGFAASRCWAICVIAHRIHDGIHKWDGSSTILPMRADVGTRSPRGILWLLNTGDHWLRIKMKDDTPMPPIDLSSHLVKDNTVNGWDSLFESRIARWMSFTSSFPRDEANSTYKDPIGLDQD